MRLEKLLNSRWFVRIVALFLAMMLYSVVNMDESPSNSPTPSLLTSTGAEENDALTNVPLIAYFDEEKYAVTNLPKEITVYLEGPNSTVTTTKLQKNYEVFVDLRELEPGTHDVRIQHKGFSDNLRVQIEPSYVSVTIQERVTQTFPVEIDFLNKEQIEKGYTTEQPIILPPDVKVTGGGEEIKEVGFVKGFVDLKGANDTIEQSIPLKVYDRNGEPLNLAVDPSVVDVKVPILAPNKTVPVIISRTGELRDGLSINSFEIIPNEVTIFGPEETIKEIEYIDDLSIDLSTITEDTKREITIPLPPGIKKVSPSTITVNIDIENEEQKNLTSIPVKIIGSSDKTNVSFTSPALGVVDLTVFGSKNVLETIQRSDFHVVLNISELSEGEHRVDLEVFGPRDVRWELATKRATIEITHKEN